MREAPSYQLRSSPYILQLHLLNGETLHPYCSACSPKDYPSLFFLGFGHPTLERHHGAPERMLYLSERSLGSSLGLRAPETAVCCWDHCSLKFDCLSELHFLSTLSSYGRSSCRERHQQENSFKQPAGVDSQPLFCAHRWALCSQSTTYWSSPGLWYLRHKMRR